VPCHPVHLNPRHQRAIELLVDKRVQEMGVGVKFTHHLTKIRVDGRLDRPPKFNFLGEDDPHPPGIGLEAGNGNFASIPAKHAPVRQLPAAARKERRFSQHHATCVGVHDVRLKRQGFRL
jgi:hypothetical protein